MGDSGIDDARNVLGGPLQVCSKEPLTGWFRDGCCNTDGRDSGLHIVCAQVTSGFLEQQKTVGNDLTTPRPEYGFRGLRPGDRWCVCLSRWKEAIDAGAIARIDLKATHEEALAAFPLEFLKRYAISNGDDGGDQRAD